MDRSYFEDGLRHTLLSTNFEGDAPRGLGQKIEGKVRDSYLRGDGTRVLITTDRISAFDRVLGTLPFKGQVLNTLAGYWFEMTSDIAKNHVISIPDPQVTVGKECQALPVEFVVRAYLTGVTSTSIYTHYEKGERVFAGHKIPDGLKKNEALPSAILTPSTKALHAKGATAHDETVSKDELFERGLITPEMFARAEEMVLALFARGQSISSKRGLILVDTKYELGLDEAGELCVIDEIHTPDSSRYWFGDTYEKQMSAGGEPESFDKEYVRRWLKEQGFQGDGAIPVLPDEIRIEASARYIEACERILGRSFVPDLREPSSRIANALGLIRS